MNPEETDIFTAVTEWYKYNRRLAQSTQVDYYKTNYDFLVSLPNEIKNIGQLRNEYIEQYIESINGEWGTRTTIVYRFTIRKFHRWLSKRYGIADIIPKRIPKLKPVKPRPVKPRKIHKPKKPLPVLKATDGSNVFVVWIEYCQQHYSKHTGKNYKSVVYQFLRFLPDEITTVNQLSSSFIESYFKTTANKYSKKSLYYHRAAITTFHRWVSQQYSIPDIVPRKLPKPKPKLEPRPIPVLRADDGSNVVVAWLYFQKSKKHLMNKKLFFSFVESLPSSIERIDQLKNEFIVNYISSIANRYKPKTLKYYRYYLRTFHHWLSSQYGIKDVVLRKPREYKPKEIKPKPEPKPLPVVKEPDGTNVIAEWMEYCLRYAKGTQRNYRFAITNFIEDSSIENIDQLNCRVIEQYISKRLGDGKKNSTANKDLITIKSFCRWLSRNYDVPNYTTGIQRLKEDPPERRVLTWEEYKKILSVCNGQNTDIPRFLANTGVRGSELVNLRWGNVSKDLKMLTVIGKGRKKRYIPLNEVCRDILQKYIRGPDDIRLNFVRYRTNRKSIYRICVNLSMKAGIPRAGPHSYRHLFATELLRRGVSITYVSKLLGHSSIAITEKAYIHFQPNFLNGLTDVLAEGKENG